MSTEIKTQVVVLGAGRYANTAYFDKIPVKAEWGRSKCEVPRPRD